MWWNKKKSIKEPTKEELIVLNILKALNLLDLQKMLKDCKIIAEKNQEEQAEFILKLVKPELEKALLSGKNSGVITGLEIDYEKYNLDSRYSNAIYNTSGLQITITDNAKRDYKNYPHVEIIIPATELHINFYLYERVTK